jgi:hypothetical protein
VRWPPACEVVSPGAEECPWLGQLGVSIVKSEKLVAEARRKGNGRRQKPLRSNG